jgi:hypothetical protein
MEISLWRDQTNTGEDLSIALQILSAIWFFLFFGTIVFMIIVFCIPRSCCCSAVKKSSFYNKIVLFCIFVTELLISWSSGRYTIGFIGFYISTLFLCYGLFKSWGKMEAEGAFGGGLLMAGAFNDRVLGRWNWSLDVILVGIGLGGAAVVQSDKAGQISTFYFLGSIFLFFFVYWIWIWWKRKEDESKSLKYPADKVTLGSPSTVYIDPASNPASLFFQVFVPQMILTILYVASLFRDVSNNYWSRGFAVLGAFFVPATLVASDIPEYLRNTRFHLVYSSIQVQGKLHLICLKDGKPAPRLSCLFLRGSINFIVNLCFPLMVIATLPIFLALSPSPSEFVLNAMAIIYVIQLDNIPVDQRSEYVFSDLMETGNVPQTSDLPANGHIEPVAEDMQVVVVAEP